MQRLLHSTLVILAVAAATGLNISCEADPTGPPEPIDALPRVLTAAERQVITSSNAFAFDLLRQVQANEDAANIFLSPLSASMALGMALNGADGETYDSMRAVLGFDGLTETQINESYRDLIALLLTLDPQIEFAIANSAWARQGRPFVESFFDRATEYFDAEVRELDFDDPASMDVINDWVKQNTQDRIDKIVSQIKPTDVLFLLNAIFFQGNWTDRFDEADTGPGAFHLEDGSTVTVDMMHTEMEAAFGFDGGVVIGELPYGGMAYVMDVVLPAPGTPIADLVASLDATTWNGWMESIHYPTDEIQVTLPKLELAYERELSDDLKAMGMAVAFDRERQNFPRLTPMPRSWVDRVKQKTFLKVDEAGTTAAAVTSVVIGADSAPPAVIADRPFLVAIRERLSGTILFLGVVGDPAE